MTKRAPPSKVWAFPVWRTPSPDSPSIIEVTEHPDTGKWWTRHSTPQRIPMTRNGRTEMVNAWVWTHWEPAKDEPDFHARRWRMQRPHYPGSLSARPNRYKKAMLPVEVEIPR